VLPQLALAYPTPQQFLKEFPDLLGRPPQCHQCTRPVHNFDILTPMMHNRAIGS
jgi:hypothetical protein